MKYNRFIEKKAKLRSIFSQLHPHPRHAKILTVISDLSAARHLYFSCFYAILFYYYVVFFRNKIRQTGKVKPC